MEPGIQIRRATPEDRPAIRALLTAAALPVDDLDAAPVEFMVASLDGELVGVAGMERLAPHMVLLRSFAVAPGRREKGVGSALLAQLLVQARRAQVNHFYLLTMSAARFFESHGFTTLPREQAPEAVRRHPQFTGLCPSSAVLMHLSGEPS